MITPQQDKIIKKFVVFSEKHHKLSLLFYELSRSLRIKAKELNTNKKFKEYLKSLDFDYDKIAKMSNTLSDISLKDLKGGVKNGI